jgi:hypothetical protein
MRKIHAVLAATVVLALGGVGCGAKSETTADVPPGWNVSHETDTVDGSTTVMVEDPKTGTKVKVRTRAQGE